MVIILWEFWLISMTIQLLGNRNANINFLNFKIIFRLNFIFQLNWSSFIFFFFIFVFFYLYFFSVVYRLIEFCISCFVVYSRKIELCSYWMCTQRRINNTNASTIQDIAKVTSEANKQFWLSHSLSVYVL